MATQEPGAADVVDAERTRSHSIRCSVETARLNRTAALGGLLDSSQHRQPSASYAWWRRRAAVRFGRRTLGQWLRRRWGRSGSIGRSLRRDLFRGPVDGPVPTVDATYTVLEKDDTGFSPGFELKDANGTLWNAKIGPEAKREVVASRFVWAMGYHQLPTYYVPRWRPKASAARSRRAPGASARCRTPSPPRRRLVLARNDDRASDSFPRPAYAPGVPLLGAGFFPACPEPPFSRHRHWARGRGILSEREPMAGWPGGDRSKLLRSSTRW
jgi:hypothetical protein